MTKKLFFIYVSVFFAISVFAQNDADTKKPKTTVKTRIHDDGTDELKLKPQSEYDGIINGSRVTKAEKNFPFVYESLYHLDKEELKKTSNSSDDNIDIDDVSRVLRSVSTMQGMKYFSTTKNKTLVLYEKAYMIEGENSKKKIADLNTGNADGQISYCYQKDNSFGDIFYRLNYYQGEKNMLAVFTTTSTIGIGPFKAIAPENLKIFIFVEDKGDEILLYLFTDLDSAKYPGIKGQITESMTSRLDAVYNWFIKQF